MSLVTNLLADGSPSVQLDASSAASRVMGIQTGTVPMWAAPVSFNCANSPDVFSTRAVAKLSGLAQQPALSPLLFPALRTLLGSTTLDVGTVGVWASWSQAASVAAAWSAVGNASGPATLASINTMTTADPLTSHLLLTALSAESLTQLKANLPAGSALYGTGGNDGPRLLVELYVRLTYNGGHQDVHFDFDVQFANH